MDYPDRWWRTDRARGAFKECFPVPVPRVPLPITVDVMSDFSPIINNWQYGDGTFRSETP